MRPRPPVIGYEAFFTHYEPCVRRYLFARGARNEVLEDAAQATMEEALRSWERLQHHPKPQAWLFTVAAQRHAKFYAEHWRLGEPTDPADFDWLWHDDPAISCDERLDLLRRLRELPSQQREALVLRCLFDLPYEQVADVMGIRPSSARGHVSRALTRLAQLYAEEEGGCT
ncbi:RNA polymerase sigma factor [Streptomyces sp. CdTB01]|uniref:RNA polymerase sigma factor n=1 Tax=Streptomyces sp. CdTB01 TaxID=1725411 RepID=UPI00131F3CDA|nr:RNA polymerase sigma factor [Streptomyces sp. CdTB01]